MTSECVIVQCRYLTWIQYCSSHVIRSLVYTALLLTLQMRSSEKHSAEDVEHIKLE